ncbi:hypothetical protein J416_08187 [Gracilibacillus halophilus YIM-C55.5]|uniref:YtpI-like protein n=1 Tax=Gracilibacillus halophilus YIM-C55.5 TaxID=1308866 RepID=N4WL88_9BACI|nr:YtpI family protein [Gracilibacillus halophilus]ENH96947.1 hypothetical protein J416_08187 [Gracilibacillus halophilus YIM-C55.5]
MIILPIVIIATFILYVYYKVMINREQDPLQQELLNAKARISLGVLISAFGINQYLYYETRIALFVTIIFLFFGILQGNAGYKRYKHYRKEWKKREQPYTN